MGKNWPKTKTSTLQKQLHITKTHTNRCAKKKKRITFKTIKRILNDNKNICTRIRKKPRKKKIHNIYRTHNINNILRENHIHVRANNTY